MQQLGFKPDRVTLIVLLNRCAVKRDLERGEALHHFILGIAGITLCDDLPLANTLVDMYCKNGSLEEGRSIFEAICRWNTVDEDNVISWNAMITAYAREEHREQALHLFAEMQLEGMRPNAVTFTLIIGCIEESTQADVIHERITSAGLDSDVIVGTGLFNMYSRVGRVSEAEAVFGHLLGGGVGDVVLWTSMLGLCAQTGDTPGALRYFGRMQLEGVRPNRVTFITLLNSCSSPAWLTSGMRIHSLLLEHELGFAGETSMLNALITMYVRCDHFPGAGEIFSRMSSRDIISWNTMIAGCSTKAFEVLHDMLLDGGVEPDCITAVTVANSCEAAEEGEELEALVRMGAFRINMDEEHLLGTALTHMNARCNRVEAAGAAFHHSMHSESPNSWGAMITALTRSRLHSEAMVLFHTMLLQGLVPDSTAFTAALDSAAAAATAGDLNHQSFKWSMHSARTICSCAVESGVESKSVISATALIHALGSIGEVEGAGEVFRKTTPDTPCWNSMLGVYARHNLTSHTLNLFRCMQQQGATPDEVSFVTLLSLCSHSGLAHRGIECYLSMTQDHGIIDLTPQLLGCVIDLLGRLGRLDDAEAVAFSGSSSGAPQWMAFLASAQAQGDEQRSIGAAQRVLELQPGDSSAALVALSNLARTSAMSRDKMITR